jgi:hypothetical protein
MVEVYLFCISMSIYWPTARRSSGDLGCEKKSASKGKEHGIKNEHGVA